MDMMKSTATLWRILKDQSSWNQDIAQNQRVVKRARTGRAGACWTQENVKTCCRCKDAMKNSMK